MGCGAESDVEVNELDTPDGEPVAMQVVTGDDVVPGSLDETFGSAGLARVKFGADDDGAFTALDVRDGQIVATGAGTGGLGEVAMRTMRFTGEGSVDSTWNAGTSSRTAFGNANTGDEAVASAVARQRDGRSVLIGTNHDAGSRAPCPCTPDLAVARFDASGALDASFGSGGRVTIDLGGDEAIHDGLVLPSDAIVAVGAQDGHFTVAQLTEAGALVTADRLERGSASRADAVALDSTGATVVAGTVTGGSIIVVTYSAAGTRTGELELAGSAGEQAVALRGHGEALYLASTAGDSVHVRRLLADGAVDPAFGVATIPDRAALDMVVFPDGSVVVLTAQSTVVRLTASGALDPAFGTAGEVAVSFGDASVPGGLQIFDADRLLVSGGDAGGTPGPGTYGVVARLRM